MMKEVVARGDEVSLVNPECCDIGVLHGGVPLVRDCCATAEKEVEAMERLTTNQGKMRTRLGGGRARQRSDCL